MEALALIAGVFLGVLRAFHCSAGRLIVKCRRVP